MQPVNCDEKVKMSLSIYMFKDTNIEGTGEGDKRSVKVKSKYKIVEKHQGL